MTPMTLTHTGPTQDLARNIRELETRNQHLRELLAPFPSSFVAGDREITITLSAAAKQRAGCEVKEWSPSSVAIAQIATYPGQIELNCKKHIDSIEQAQKVGASVVI